MATVDDGTYPLGPGVGRLLVKTGRTGLGSRAGHDLTLEVTRWEGSATVDTTEPAHCSVTVDAEAGSLEVREGTGGVKPLSDSDRAEIERALREKLDTGENPTVTFRSTGVKGSAESFTVDGDLTVAGATRQVTIRGGMTGGRARGETTVTQSRWGIKPYTAFFGALKLADDVTVEFDLTLEP